MILLLGEMPSSVSSDLTRPCRNIRRHSKKIQSLVRPRLHVALFTTTGHMECTYSAILEKQNRISARQSPATEQTNTHAHRFVILSCESGSTRQSLRPKCSKKQSNNVKRPWKSILSLSGHLST